MRLAPCDPYLLEYLFSGISGADEETRTLDRPFTKRVLYQLSYIGVVYLLLVPLEFTQ